jgi:hypothetical protein
VCAKASDAWWQVRAIKLGLILLACLLGLAQFRFFRAKNVADWRWKGFFVAYLSPIITVAGIWGTRDYIAMALRFRRKLAPV